MTFYSASIIEVLKHFGRKSRYGFKYGVQGVNADVSLSNEESHTQNEQTAYQSPHASLS